MIRFIDIGKQIAQDANDSDWPREFALYDTLEARFVCLDGREVWDSVEDIVECLDDDDSHIYQKRILSVIAEWVPKKKQTITR